MNLTVWKQDSMNLLNKWQKHLTIYIKVNLKTVP